MTAVKGDGPPDHLALRLRLALLRFRGDVTAAMAGRPVPTDLTASHFRVLDQLPRGGARVTDIAQRARITKQALGQLARQLADRGYVEIVDDPDDRRAKVVRCTRRGEGSRRAVRAAMATVEDRWRAQVGPERYAVFRAVLEELTAQFVEDEPAEAAAGQ